MLRSLVVAVSFARRRAERAGPGDQLPADQRHGLSDQPAGGLGERFQHVDAQRPAVRRRSRRASAGR